MNVGPYAMINVGNQLHSESPESQSTSMNTTAHQVHQGHWKPGDDILMLRSSSCYVSPCCDLLRLPLPVDHQRSPGGALFPIQSAVTIPSGVHGNPRRSREEARTSRFGLFDVPLSHDFANYAIFGPMRVDINDSK